MPAQRQTTQRRVIEQVIAASDRPMSVPEIHAAAQAELPALGSATVYRAVNDLVADGQLKPVDLPGATARYEKADLAHHHHFHCTVCDRVFDIAGCALAERPRVPRGFKVESHEIVLYGRCADCAKS